MLFVMTLRCGCGWIQGVVRATWLRFARNCTAPVNEMGRGFVFTHQPTHTAYTEITPGWRRQQPSTHALGHSE